MLRTHNIEFSYSNKKKFVFPNIECQRGEQLLLLGASGVGKTTLLHLLGGLLHPTQGEILVNQQPLAALKGAMLDQFRGRNIGIIFQQPHFLRALTVEENLILAQQLVGFKPDKSLINNYLEKLNVAHLRTNKTTHLSVGEQQRINIVRALINRPVLLLADEPTSALDDANCKEVLALLKTHATAAALVIVTHDSRLKSEVNNQITLGSL
jgi:ABC-type lipoprotein export system ATPase subunit